MGFDSILTFAHLNLISCIPAILIVYAQMKSKIILFDLLQAQPSADGAKYHGGGEYIKTIFMHLANNFFSRAEINVFFNKDLFLDAHIIDLIKEKNITSYNIKNANQLQDLVAKQPFDTFFSGLPDDYSGITFSGNTKKIGVKHGLRVIEKPSELYGILYQASIRQFLKASIKAIFPTFFRKRSESALNKLLNWLDAVVCVSSHTRYAVKNVTRFPDKRLQVLYSPLKHSNTVDGDIGDSALVSGKYILLISANRWEKNSFRAIRAIEDLIRRGKLEGCRIVLVGKLPPIIKRYIHDLSQYIFLDYITPGSLENLYKYCEVFLYPTLNEGFGYPPLEAMRYGKTCVVSAVCSLPEIYGDAVYWVNPYDTLEIQNRLLWALDEKIPTERIAERVKAITHRQNQDLETLCKLIVR